LESSTNLAQRPLTAMTLLILMDSPRAATCAEVP
jgi:hypothetical protein